MKQKEEKRQRLIGLMGLGTRRLGFLENQSVVCSVHNTSACIVSRQRIDLVCTTGKNRSANSSCALFNIFLLSNIILTEYFIDSIATKFKVHCSQIIPSPICSTRFQHGNGLHKKESVTELRISIPVKWIYFISHETFIYKHNSNNVFIINWNVLFLLTNILLFLLTFRYPNNLISIAIKPKLGQLFCKPIIDLKNCDLVANKS